MTVKVMQCPNPNRNMERDRVIVVARSDDGKFLRVLNLSAIERDPTLLKPFGAGYSGAATFWNAIGIAITLGGIATAFFWHWWAFIPGIILGFIVIRANSESIGQHAAEVIANNPDALTHFAARNMVWDAPTDEVVPA